MRFDEVTAMSLVAHFLEHGVFMAYMCEQLSQSRYMTVKRPEFDR